MISVSALGATALTLLLLIFGPQEGLESLATGILAYLTLLYHIAIGPVFIVYWFRARKITAGFLAMMGYLLCIWGYGLYQYIVINDIDDAARDFIESRTEPANHRLRELGERLYLQHNFRGGADENQRVEWHRLASEVSDVNRRDEKRKAPLWYAAAIGDEEMVELLLAAGARTDDIALYPTTPLAAAIDQGHAGVVELLLEAGANPDEGKNKHYPSVSLATKHGQLPIVESLLAAGANVDLGDPAAFSIALKAGRSDLVSLLLGAGATPVVHFDNRLPIEFAIESGDHEMVLVLLARTDGFEMRTGVRDPLLFQRVSNCDVEGFRQALAQGANPDVESNKGLRIFERLIRLDTRHCDLDSRRSEFAELLIGAGADLDYRDQTGVSLALLALRHGRVAIARTLEARSASLAGEVNKKDFLMLASALGADDLVARALDRGFDPNRWSEGLNKSNALYEAADAGHRDTVSLLLSRGAEMPPEAIGYRKIFRSAAKHPAALRLLLEKYQSGERSREFDTAIRSSVLASKRDEAIALLDEYGMR